MLPNISIGTGHVVGVGLVAAKDIDNYVIVTDVPAKKLKGVEAN
jgi:acetyltransferase-like isoleucine patch superfamily enzyme